MTFDLSPFKTFAADLEKALADKSLTPALEAQVKAVQRELNRTMGGNWQEEMMLGLLAELLKMAAEPDGAPAPSASPFDGPLTYYKVRATHDRSRTTRAAPMKAEFTGAIAAVRVRLPHHADPTASFQTEIGDVSARDHVAFSVDEVYAAYATTFTEHDHELSKPDLARNDIDRVDLITGGRRGAHRFCPVSIYLAYAADGRALFYAVQSSNFFGQEARLYVARALDAPPIIARSGFKPTPFASPDHCYRFWMEVDALPAPEDFTLGGQIYFGSRPDKPREGELVKYMDMTMIYEKVDRMGKSPVRAQAEAYARVCLLEDWQGEVHHDTSPMGPKLHALGAFVGGRQGWSKKPPSGPEALPT